MAKKVRGIFKHPPHIERKLKEQGYVPNFRCFTYDTAEEARAAAQEHANKSKLPVLMVIGGVKYSFMPEENS